MRLLAIAGFAAAILPMIVTPGASFTLLTRHVMQHGRRRSVPVITGTVTGLFVHASLAAVGLAALVMRSSQLFTIVRIVGAVYLFGLGLSMMRARPSTAAPSVGSHPFLQALMGNVLNIKAAGIYLTLVPQFIDPSQPVATQIFTLAATHAVVLTLWLSVWTALIGRARAMMQSGDADKYVRRVAGAVLITLGLRAAVEP